MCLLSHHSARSWPTDSKAAQGLMERPWKLATPNLWRQRTSAEGEELTPIVLALSPQSKALVDRGQRFSHLLARIIVQRLAVMVLACRGSLGCLSAPCSTCVKP